MSEHLYTYDNPPSERHIARVCDLLSHNGVIAYPGDTNWGFACDASSPKALDRIRSLKPHHPKDQPFSLLCNSISMAADYVTIEHSSYRLLKKIWPGPYTVLLQRNRTLARQIKDKRRLVGIRIPKSPLIAAIIHSHGKALATTSAPDPSEFDRLHFGYQVFEHFGHGIDLLLDLGAEVAGVESTIIDLSSGAPVLLRQGAGPIDGIDFVSGEAEG